MSAPATPAAAPPSVQPTAQSAPAPTPAGADDIVDVWRRVGEAAGDKASAKALLGTLKLVSVAPGRAVLSASDPAQLAYARQRSEQLADLFKRAVGTVVKVTLTAGDAGEDQGASGAPLAVDPADREALEDPLVKRAVELFNARVVSVHRDDPR